MEDMKELALEERTLFMLKAVTRNDAVAVQQGLQNGAKVNCVCRGSPNPNHYYTTPLLEACEYGYDEIVRILLDAGAYTRWKGEWWGDSSPISVACQENRLSTVEILLNHDKSLLERENEHGWTPLLVAILAEHSDIVRFLLDRGANVHKGNNTKRVDCTYLMLACQRRNMDIARLLLLNADVDLEARDNKRERTALHFAAETGGDDILRDLILDYNGNMFAVDRDGKTPFDLLGGQSNIWPVNVEQFLDIYGNKVRQEHGRLALHAIFGAAEYALAPSNEYNSSFSPLRVRLPMGTLTLEHLCILLKHLGMDLLRHHDDSGKLPIHIACRNNAPVEILMLLLVLDSTTLHVADHSGTLPIHEYCRGGGAVDHSSVLYLVENVDGGVGTLAVRNREGALPLHVLCGSTNPSLQTVQYMMESYPESVAAQTNSGLYPFMMAAGKASSASLSVVYDLVRANPALLVSS